jgi:hypothetical protein
MFNIMSYVLDMASVMTWLFGNGISVMYDKQFPLFLFVL